MVLHGGLGVKCVVGLGWGDVGFVWPTPFCWPNWPRCVSFGANDDVIQQQRFPVLASVIGRTYFRDFQLRSLEIIQNRRISRNFAPQSTGQTSVDL